MTSIRPKRPVVRLDPASYSQLCLEVLHRDRWRCQYCGSLENLQVHHKEFRSRSGPDSEDNLITLCADCHRSVHRSQSQHLPIPKNSICALLRSRPRVLGKV